MVFPLALEKRARRSIKSGSVRGGVVKSPAETAQEPKAHPQSPSKAIKQPVAAE